jgi:hypothetical protein
MADFFITESQVIGKVHALRSTCKQHHLNLKYGFVIDALSRAVGCKSHADFLTTIRNHKPVKAFSLSVFIERLSSLTSLEFAIKVEAVLIDTQYAENFNNHIKEAEE